MNGKYELDIFETREKERKKKNESLWGFFLKSNSSTQKHLERKQTKLKRTQFLPLFRLTNSFLNKFGFPISIFLTTKFGILDCVKLSLNHLKKCEENKDKTKWYKPFGQYSSIIIHSSVSVQIPNKLTIRGWRTVPIAAASRRKSPLNFGSDANLCSFFTATSWLRQYAIKLKK